MKFAQLVIGPAGCGKSTYCSILQQHCEFTKRLCRVINLDPAAEEFDYECHIDIRDLISVNDVAEEMELGPNGALIYAMEYFLDHLEWLEDQLSTFSDDEYFLIDCPGQIELYSHLPVMRYIVDCLQSWDVRICGVYCIDSGYISDATKMLAGSLSALSAMLQLEIPHVNLLTKCDLIVKDIEDKEKADNILDHLIDREPSAFVEELKTSMPPKFRELNIAFGNILEDYSLVSYVTLNSTDEESIRNVLMVVDIAIQYGENIETRDDFDMGGGEEEEGDIGGSAGGNGFAGLMGL